MQRLDSAENDLQLLGLPSRGDARPKVPLTFPRLMVTLQRKRRAAVMTIVLGANLRWFVKMEVILANFVRTRQFRRPTKMADEQQAMQSIRGLGIQFSSGAKQVAIAAPVVIDETGGHGIAALNATKSRAANTFSGKRTILINC